MFKILFVLIVIYYLYRFCKAKAVELKDREEFPEKWKKIDAERAAKRVSQEADEYVRKHEKAMRTVPKSDWMLMSCEEKSRVLKKREALKPAFDNLPSEVKEAVRNMGYGRPRF